MPPASQREARNQDGVFIIAEAGVNHNGSTRTGPFARCGRGYAGADAVKFQTFRAEELTTRTAPKADYQAKATRTRGTQYDMLKALELDFDAYRRLAEACRDHGIEFMSTAFDQASIDFLVNDIGVVRLKSPSGDLTNGPYLLKLARSGLPIILSTGMATLTEIKEALAVLAYGYTCAGTPKSLDAIYEQYRSGEGCAALKRNVTVLHCTSAYPTPPIAVNLRAIQAIADAFGLRVGYSDHTLGTHIAVAAVANGARVIEKHFTLDRSLPGPDHVASLEPSELKQIVAQIRDVTAALGDGIKRPAEAEQGVIAVARRSIVAAGEIKAGEALAGRLAVKRPASGISPMNWWVLQARLANRDYAEDEPIDPSLLE